MPAARFYAFCLVTGTSALAGAQAFPWLIHPESTKALIARAGASRIRPPKINKGQDPTENAIPSVPATTTNVSQPEVTPEKKPRKTNWLERAVVQRVQVSGNRVFGFHSHQVEGDASAFDSLNYYGRGSRRFTDSGNMTVSGKNVLGFLNFDLAYSTTDFNDPNSQKVTLNYSKGPWALSAGDISGRLLNTNPYANLSRMLRGTSAEYKAGRFNARALRSEARGSTRTVSLQGANSTGPYYLESGRIVADSVQVEVDGQPMRIMEDYVVNSDLGSITFVSRIIAPTSTVVVTYESYGFGTAGTVQGAGMTYDFGKFGRLGLTGVQQTTGSSGIGGSQIEKFFGYGDPSNLYSLRYEPIPGTVLVKVDGIPQAQGIDYAFLADTPYIFQFKRFIAPSQLIDVIYRPKSVQNLDGDRNVWGFDYRLPFGKTGRGGYLQYSQASGSLLSESNPMSGIARGIEGQYKFGEFTFNGSVRDIPREFVSVQSVGFQRNEKATDLSLDWKHRRWSLNASSSNSLIANQTLDDDSNVIWQNARYTRTSASASYSIPEGDSWTLQQTRQRSFYGGHRQLDTTALTGRHRFGHLDTDYSFQNQSGFFPYLNDDSTVSQESVALQTFGVGARYNLESGLGINARASLSRVSALDETNNGNDYSLGATYNPEKGRLRLGANYTFSNNGQAAALGDFGGYGYGGNGFSSGSPGLGTVSPNDTSLRAISFSGEYQASNKMNLDVHAVSSETEGSLTSNSRTLSYGMGLDWDLGNFNQFGISIDKTNTRFLQDTAVTSDTISFDAFLAGAPRGPWSYRLGVSRFLSGSSSLYASDAFNFDGMLGYKLTPRQRLSVQFITGRTTGYYGQSEDAWYMSYEHQLYGNVSLIGSYKIRDVRNLSVSESSGSYRSRGFDLELSFNFR